MSNESALTNEQLDPKLIWAEQKEYQVEQLALDVTRLMSCTQDRLDDYKDKGFFKRVVSYFSGQTAKMERDNQNDIIELQKIGWSYLQHLDERNLLTAHSLVTIKNNLDTLAVNEGETRREVTRFAIRVKERFEGLEKRVEEIEIQTEVNNFIQRLDVKDEVQKSPPYLRSLILIRELQNIKLDAWTKETIEDLFVAFKKVGIDIGEISMEEFIGAIVDEIESHGLDGFISILELYDATERKIPSSFIINSIESPVFISLYRIADKYSDISDTIEANAGDLKIEKSEAIKNALLKQIQNFGVDTTKTLEFKNIALEIVSCNRLAIHLHSDEQTLVDNQITTMEAHLEINESSFVDESILVNNDLQLSLQPNYIGCGSDFCIVIDQNGKIKSIGENDYGQLGIGNKEKHDNDILADVIDLPADKRCISISVGKNHAMALLENGDVYAWGDGGCGKLGDDTDDGRLAPFKTMGLPKDKKPVKIIAGADSSLVLLENGEVYATGSLAGSLVFKHYPLPFKTKNIEMLYASSDNGIVFVDDTNNAYIRILHPYYIDWCETAESDLYRLRGLPPECEISQIVTGSNYLFAILSTGEVYGIGANNEAQLGVGERDYSPADTFKKIYTIKDNISQMATNKSSSSVRYDDGVYRNFVLALTQDNIYGWGDNSDKQLGEQKEYCESYHETGSFLWKESHINKHYRNLKPTILAELNQTRSENIKCYIACADGASVLYSRSHGSLFLLGRKFNQRWQDNDDKVAEYSASCDI